MKSKKSIILLVSLILLIGVTIVGTVALLTTEVGPIKNIFNPSKVTTKVDETLSGDTKSDVRIQNTGDTEAYIRAAVVITWQDEKGNVYGKLPVLGTDYSEFNSETGWVKGSDGFYYWTEPVLSKEEYPNDCYTGKLMDECRALKEGPTSKDKDGNIVQYYLNVEIIASGIQSKPAHVVEDEWSNEHITIVVEDNEQRTLRITNNNEGGN